MYGSSGDTETLEDKYTNALNDMKENDYKHNQYSSSGSNEYNSNGHSIDYGHQKTTSSSPESR